jgi:hypothetical protein
MTAMRGSRPLFFGEIPTAAWQRLDRTLTPKLKSGKDLRVGSSGGMLLIDRIAFRLEVAIW